MINSLFDIRVICRIRIISDYYLISCFKTSKAFSN